MKAKPKPALTFEDRVLNAGPRNRYSKTQCAGTLKITVTTFDKRFCGDPPLVRFVHIPNEGLRTTTEELLSGFIKWGNQQEAEAKRAAKERAAARDEAAKELRSRVP